MDPFNIHESTLMTNKKRTKWCICSFVQSENNTRCFYSVTITKSKKKAPMSIYHDNLRYKFSKLVSYNTITNEQEILEKTKYSIAMKRKEKFVCVPVSYMPDTFLLDLSSIIRKFVKQFNLNTHCTYLQESLEIKEESINPIDKLSYHLFGSKKLVINSILNENQKNSASDSIIGFGKYLKNNTLTDIKIAIKIACEGDVKNDNSLFVERYIYQNVVPKLLKETPNVVACVDILTCENLLEKSFEYQSKYGLAKDLYNMMYKLNLFDESCKDRPIYILMTERSEGVKLYDFMMEDYRDMEKTEKHNVMTQILIQMSYTLHIFEKNKFMHNDLHFGNIFITKLDKPIDYNIILPESGKEYTHKISYLLKIYDFDRSSFNNGKPMKNTRLETEHCGWLGDCNKFQKNKDWFTFTHMMYRQNLEKFSGETELTDVMFDIFIDLFDTATLIFPGRPCTKTSKYKCDIINIEDRKSSILFLEHIIQTLTN